MKKIDLNSLTKNFILNEGKNPDIDVDVYIQALFQDLQNISPKTLSDKRRITIMSENLRNLRRHVKNMNNKIQTLQEELNVIKEKR